MFLVLYYALCRINRAETPVGNRAENGLQEDAEAGFLPRNNDSLSGGAGAGAQGLVTDVLVGGINARGPLVCNGLCWSGPIHLPGEINRTGTAGDRIQFCPL